MPAPQNRTLTLSDDERRRYAPSLAHLRALATVESLTDAVVCQDFFDTAAFLPHAFVDLLILDPPYNLTKEYGKAKFAARNAEAYTQWFTALVEKTLPTLKKTATVYVCSDWKTSTVIYPVLERSFKVRNRITWEREKGRGAKTNWKNNTEDIWFCTMSDDYFFDVEAVKILKRVLAPYHKPDGSPKDWKKSKDGNFRRTCPSNLWTDLTVPFWSMRENTPHPTQKPEKLLAKLILASTREGDFVFDPMAGSGTTGVVARKLHRHFTLVERETEYCMFALKRLEHAVANPSIQGYENGIFRERNSVIID
ncbi:MAG: site-specific DNA-methyltransferase [Planctomycetia bacterium]|nr:site-specific DNA-methyltransferase [Planctomycetia bacterium]